jgi:hypothetical protein
MRRPNRTARFKPVLNTAEMAMTPSIDDGADGQDCRAFLVRIPEQWEFKRIEDGRLAGEIETVVIRRRHPDGIPAGRYLRLPVETLADPWGRVSVGLEFDTPEGSQHAELTFQSHDEPMGDDTKPDDAIGPEAPAFESIQIDVLAVRELSGTATVFFVEGDTGDVVDLSGDEVGRWVIGDSDGTHTLYIRSDASGKRGPTLAVRNGIAVKLP